MSFATFRAQLKPIHLTIAIVVMAVLATVALPTYEAHIRRSRVLPALVQLSTFTLQMERRYQNDGNYGAAGNCALPAPDAADFVITCTATHAGQGFVASAIGIGPAAGYIYTVDQSGHRATTAHPSGTLLSSCWSLRTGSCDA